MADRFRSHFLFIFGEKEIIDHDGKQLQEAQSKHVRSFQTNVNEGFPLFLPQPFPIPRIGLS